MSKPRVFIFVNGVHGDCEGVDAWQERAVDYVLTTAHEAARAFEYECWGSLRWIGQKRRVRQLAAMVRKYSHFDVVLGGHSNGGAMIADLLRDHDIEIHSAHLIASAGEADFNESGLNYALMIHRVQYVHCYFSANDMVLKHAPKRRGLLKRLGMGYGEMGLRGPENVGEVVASRVIPHRDNRMGHSSWLQGENFNETMRQVVFS